VTPGLVTAVAAASRRALAPYLDADWSVPARGVDWTCYETAAHLADGWFAHAARIAGQPTEWFVPATLTVDDPVTPVRLLQVFDACAELLRCAAIVTDAQSRAYHPWGASDPAGSVAMASAEALVHTWDIVGGLGGDWRPPDELARPVLDRIFPDAPAGPAGDVLLWCCGRIALPDHPRQETWRWYGEPRG
jgi:hypothetical protein